MVQHGSSLNTVHTTCIIPCALCKSNMMEERSTHREIKQTKKVSHGYLNVHTNVTQEKTSAYVMKYKKLLQ